MFVIQSGVNPVVSSRQATRTLPRLAMPRLCQNLECCWAKNGGRARVGPNKDLCVFCDYEAMEDACLTAAGRSSILQSLKAMTDPNLRWIALEELIPEEFRQHFRNGVGHSRFCAGFEDEPCIFALSKTGGPAQVHKRRAAVCLFCDPAALGAKYDSAAGRKEVANALKQMSPAAREKMLAERISADVKEEIKQLLRPAEPKRLGRRPAAQTTAEELKTRWATALAKRQSSKAGATAAEKKAYREQVLADRARGRKHAGRPKERTAPGTVVDNEAPLPPAKRSARAAGLERWALY